MDPFAQFAASRRPGGAAPGPGGFAAFAGKRQIEGVGSGVPMELDRGPMPGAPAPRPSAMPAPGTVGPPPSPTVGQRFHEFARQRQERRQGTGVAANPAAPRAGNALKSPAAPAAPVIAQQAQQRAGALLRGGGMR